jgi:hypothetical protein
MRRTSHLADLAGKLIPYWWLPWLLVFGALRAFAHTAPSGTWQYDLACCSERDCAPVPARFIRATPQGFAIHIPAGAHPFVQGTALTALVPHQDGRVRPSGDGQHHACISPARTVLCIYIPPGGV